MQELVAEKLEGLKDHLDNHGIDLTIVTFRWFLTVFVDGLPTEVLLQVLLLTVIIIIFDNYCF